MNRNEAQSKHKWDFSGIYENHNKWKEDSVLLKKYVDELSSLKGKLNEEKNFLLYLELDEKVDKLNSKLGYYINLINVDSTNSELQELSSLYNNALNYYNINTSFIKNELLTLGEDLINKWIIKNKKEHYLFNFKEFFRNQGHILEKSKEELLSKVSRSREAVANLYDVLAYADKQEVSINHDGRDKVLTTTLYYDILQNSIPNDQNIRQKAWELYFKNIIDNKHSFAKIYESILQKQFEDFKVRKFKSVLEMNLFHDNIGEKTYLKLIEVGEANINIFTRYLRLLKKSFKLDKFFTTDKDLNLVSGYNKTFNVDEGLEIVKESLKGLGEDYLNYLSIASQDSKIDYFESLNKMDGAYSSGGNGLEPIILMNWDDKINSVFTLAHELGHSVHTIFADRYQQYPNTDYPIILAEVASTFNEHLLFDYLFENTETKEDKIYLLQQRITDLIATFFRQIQFADFEYSAHRLIENSEPVTSETLMNLFKEKEDKFGYDFFDNKDRNVYNWPFISHFFHSPFYVHKYALDIVASYKLYTDYKKGDKEGILNFLKSGGHKEPMSILNDCGVNFEQLDTYLPFLAAMNDYLDLLEDLLFANEK